jgi:hypothetical protein
MVLAESSKGSWLAGDGSQSCTCFTNLSFGTSLQHVVKMTDATLGMMESIHLILRFGWKPGICEQMHNICTAGLPRIGSLSDLIDTFVGTVSTVNVDVSGGLLQLKYDSVPKGHTLLVWYLFNSRALENSHSVSSILCKSRADNLYDYHVAKL